MIPRQSYLLIFFKPYNNHIHGYTLFCHHYISLEKLQNVHLLTIFSVILPLTAARTTLSRTLTLQKTCYSDTKYYVVIPLVTPTELVAKIRSNLDPKKLVAFDVNTGFKEKLSLGSRFNLIEIFVAGLKNVRHYYGI